MVRSRQSGCSQEAQKEGFSSAQAVFGKFPLCHQEEMVYRHVGSHTYCARGLDQSTNEMSLPSLLILKSRI